ncbi:MAG: Dna2/Cas4 domain-containing protein [DPANN group archaeon]|nr:Dna2/Cas4 domain-containing protein [DPANN group archaeon]
MKIKCTTGELHDIEHARECPSCLADVPKPILHSLLFGKDRARTPKEKPAFGVGTLVTECLRQSYYKLTEEEILDLEKLWIFSRGHAIHEFITRTLEDKKEKEIFIRSEFQQFDVIGFIDAMHLDTIYEFKTTGTIPETPQTHHVLQVQGYYSMLPEEKKKVITKIKIVYLSLQKIKSFDVPKRDILPFLESRAAQLTLALRYKVPPEREVGWQCKYCEFYDMCFKRDAVLSGPALAEALARAKVESGKNNGAEKAQNIVAQKTLA